MSDARLFFRSFLERNTEPLIGIVSAKDVAMVCGELYAQENGLTLATRELIAYYLPRESVLPDEETGAPQGKALLYPAPSGELRQASPSDWQTIIKWIYAFYAETLRAAPPTAEPKRPDEKKPPSPVGKVEMYVWWDTRPVAMGMLTGTGDTCRLNLIFTPPRLRGKGYGRAIVAALSAHIRKNNQLPVLYTTADNIAANNLYTSMGFREAGRLTEVRFHTKSEIFKENHAQFHFENDES